MLTRTYARIDNLTKEHVLFEIVDLTEYHVHDTTAKWVSVDNDGWIYHGGQECPVPYHYWIKYKLLGEVEKNPCKHYTVYTGSAEIRWDRVYSYKLLSYKDSDGTMRPFYPPNDEPEPTEEQTMQNKIKFPAYISILEEGEDHVDGDLILANLYHVKSLDHLQHILLFCCGGIETMDETFKIIYNQETLTIRVKTSITIDTLDDVDWISGDDIA